MSVHLFGATSSPGVANFVLKKVADLYEAKHGKEAADFVRRQFYVDDGFVSRNSPKSLVELAQSARDLCREGGFNLTKFTSTAKEVVDSIPPEALAKDANIWSLERGEDNTGTALGMGWDQLREVLRYLVKEMDVKYTRRSMLSLLGGVYDPMGLIGPILLPGRKILRNLCKRSFGWDDVVDSDSRELWKRFIENLREVVELCVPRCLRTVVWNALWITLHIFCDASLEGLGVAVYVKFEDDNAVDVRLVYAKSKVAPLNAVTVPRLELQAAVLAVRVGMFVEAELDYELQPTQYYSNSTSVLGYLANDGARYTLYVHNRGSFIRQHTLLHQWHHVDTALNPADVASRGATVKELKEDMLWWSGPQFLKEPGVRTVHEELYKSFLDPDDPELKKTVQTQNTRAAPRMFSLVERLCDRVSGSWLKQKRVVAIWRRYMLMLQLKARRKPLDPVAGPLVVEELVHAETAIVRVLQKEEFDEDLKILTKTTKKIGKKTVRHRHARELKGSSVFYRLDAYMSRDGTVRAGGRLKKAGLSPNHVNPRIVPRRHPMVRAMVRRAHYRVAHGGRQATLHELRRSGYWIAKGRSTVDDVLKDCLICSRLRGKPCSQMMADLPETRVQVSEPFTYSGVDIFGPFLVQAGRSNQKMYGCLFTCLCMRAIHIEVVESLTTDAFLFAYRRFAGRRGPIRQLYSDQGTNFVGADNRLKAGVKELDMKKIASQLLKEDCDLVTFKFNAPSSSHMGGVWERMIRSARQVLDGLLTGIPGRLTSEELRTLMVETENIVNSRPISFISGGDVEELTPLSPSQILMLKSDVVKPLPGVFVAEDIYARERWRTVQVLANRFWTRWRETFLPELSQRKKWHHAEHNLSVNDVVVVMDGNAPRNKWMMDRVDSVFEDDDGLVRRVHLQVPGGFMVRPVVKLVLLCRGDRGVPVEEPV